MPRSIMTMVVASVLDPAIEAVSAMRMTSPPILLGRKLLKKVATRKEACRRLTDVRAFEGGDPSATRSRRSSPDRGRGRRSATERGRFGGGPEALEVHARENTQAAPR